MRSAFLAVLTAIFVGTAGAAAAKWPDQPTLITITVGSSAGGAADLSVRVLAPFLEKHLGPNAKIAVVNLPGAGGEIAFNDIANAKPDGTRINVASMPNLVSRLAEDPTTSYSLDDFTYLGHIVASPAAFAVPIQSQFKSLQELVDYARANPGKLSAAVGGMGNDDHLALLQFMRDQKLDLNVIPFGDGAMSRNAVMGGSADLGTMGAVESHNFPDALRMLAVMASERMYFAPEVPTARELGFDIVGGASRGVIAPKGLPPEIRDAFVDAIHATVTDPDYVAQMQKQSLFIDYKDPADYEAYVRGQLAILQDLFKSHPWK